MHESGTFVRFTQAGANDVEIIFTDDGCGMSADVWRQAFDPFFTTRRHQGCVGAVEKVLFG